MAAQGGARRLADDRDHRLVIELGVVEAVQEMDRARSRSRQADADLAGELGVAAGHERRLLLVTDLDELDLVGAPEGGQDAVDAVTGIAVDALHAPPAKPLQQEIADGVGHDRAPLAALHRLDRMQRMMAGSGTAGGQNWMRAIPKPEFRRRRRCAGVSTMVTSSVGRTMPFRKWPPRVLPSSRPSTACMCRLAWPSSPIAMSPSRVSPSHCWSISIGR